MEQPFVPALVVLTSVGAYVFGIKRLGWSGMGIRSALSRMLECVGMILVFFLVNLAAGVMAILAVRLLTRGFVPLYLIGDETLLVLSLLQGLAFYLWRESSRPWSG